MAKPAGWAAIGFTDHKHPTSSSNRYIPKAHDGKHGSIRIDLPERTDLALWKDNNGKWQGIL